MQVERLRLTGFKSFVEATELAIRPGLTGIVGPNGCGKSNLVEALRWVMGEASAKRVRGSEMDDVIFGGSGGRTARNLAEVALTVDNSRRDAPFAFNESTTIEVVRRIVRGAGSSYRINGREVRARDVQLLFADAASGPHSGALVGQGRIGELISARPSERRALLDEAAGTAGLHTRRHEAELRLNAADDNLARLDDVIAGFAAQLAGLKKQARQAERYRRLGEQIRRTEAQLLDARWRHAAAEAEALALESQAAGRHLAAMAEVAMAREDARAGSEAALPPLRLRQAAAAAEVQRLGHARASLEQELRRVTAARADAERRLQQIAADRRREAAHVAEAEAALARLGDEQSTLEHAGAEAASGCAAAAAGAEAAARELAAAETELQQATEACAASEARRAALDRQRRELIERRSRVAARLAEAERQRIPLLGAIVSAEALAAASAAVDEAGAAVEAGRETAERAAERLASSQNEEAASIEAARDAERVLASLGAEAKALTRLLAAVERPAAEGPSVLSQLHVPAGFEAAVAALFDGELASPVLLQDRDPAVTAPAGWIELAPFTAAPLPEGARLLEDELAAPRALHRRLRHAGWVDDPADGWRLQHQLGPGQSLVDRAGRLWRWDGYVRTAAAPNAMAEQLRQRNRLEQLTAEIATAEAAARSAAEQAALARAKREAAAAAERGAVAALRASEERLLRARESEADLARRGLAAEARLAAVTDAIERHKADIAELAQQIAETEGMVGLLPDPGLMRSRLDAVRERTAAARRDESEARAMMDRAARDAERRRHRLTALAAESEAWRQRQADAAAHQITLAERYDETAAEVAAWGDRPAAIAAENEMLARDSAVAAAEREAADGALSQAEKALREAADAAREAEQSVGEARENRARIEARREAAEDTLSRLRGEIAERLDLAPEELAEVVSASGMSGANGEAEIAARLERLIRERDGIGPVNLLAERETAEVEARLAGLEHERADLTAAIAQLRRGIAGLDAEGRRRLIAAFDALNGHFGELFSRLFGGGKAELAWAGGDDPLEAGLEILASPPGKRLGSLSLLSGGEQALTGIALVFAMFLTNPAPVCVLDEVDAPLDDANVDGFCRLLADIADTTGTRFLVITHHRVTMARMDRLFGVTMAERGVSQLVSVDLARAAELRQTG